MFKKSLVCALIACGGLAAFAADSAAPAASAPSAQEAQHPGFRQHKHDWQAMFDHHMAKFKVQLQLGPQQEAAWNQFIAAMRPPAERPAAPVIPAMEKMTTPERIDALKALRARRDAEMEQRATATKTFYASLNEPQRKVFDQESLRWMRHRQHGSMHGGWRAMQQPAAAGPEASSAMPHG